MSRRTKPPVLRLISTKRDPLESRDERLRRIDEGKALTEDEQSAMPRPVVDVAREAWGWAP